MMMMMMMIASAARVKNSVAITILFKALHTYKYFCRNATRQNRVHLSQKFHYILQNKFSYILIYCRLFGVYTGKPTLTF